MLQKVRTDLQSRLHLELVDALLSSYEEIKQNFYLGKHEPSELNGGKFVEACFRILQCENNAGNYTPVGTQISNLIGKLRDFERIPTASAIDSFRIHIPRILVAMYNIRNKRGVGHLGGDVSPNKADASLLVACADWVMAELFRIYYQCSLEEAQMVVDALVQRRLALVHELEDTKRVLLSSLSYKDKTLLLLASEFPDRVLEADLLDWIEPKDKSDYRRRILRTLHSERMIEYEEPNWCKILPPGLRYVVSQYPRCRILPPGLRYVESQYPHWLNKLMRAKPEIEMPEALGEYLQRFPKSIKDVDRILIAAYFVQSHEPENFFNTRGANKLLIEQSIKVANASAYVKSNAEKGFVFALEKGKFRVSQPGIDYIRELMESRLSEAS